ncbi:IPT/TIG domain-containing protein [Streptomyces sioyaensis]|uniref:beta strand repeat-containing protein n=1 Tax=Streptomyces sioyaensis TaxID=67364 RepID=UPI0033C67235
MLDNPAGGTPVVFANGAPTATGITPASGPSSGNTFFTINGTNLFGATVLFDTNPATNVTVNGAGNTLTGRTPAGTTGNRIVTVTTSTGSTTVPGGFTYTAPTPTAANITPASGPSSGNTFFTINGTNLFGATVLFDTNPATNVTVNGAGNTLTGRTPAGTTGNRIVTVTTSTGSTTVPGGFTYTAPTPTLTSLNPTSGSTAGGTTVILTGTTFTGATGVHFGASPAIAFTALSPSQASAVAPPGSGTVQVTITTPSGTSNALPYTYKAPPIITSVAPLQGPVAGRNTVTITGASLTGTTNVTFGATDATGFTVVSATQITATAPAGIAGETTLTVTTPGGTASASYYYISAPIITALSPISGPLGGGNTITLTGQNFTLTTAVTFGATPATSYTVTNDTQITATAPASAAGNQPVTVTTPGGTSNPTIYTPTPAPTIIALSPTTGPQTGGTPITITGTDLTTLTSIQFGTQTAGFTITSPTQATTTAPPGTGTVQITATTTGGTSNPLPYTYTPPPAI